ncbi:hypothetical protein D3C80_1668460 [compost metagenome]
MDDVVGQVVLAIGDENLLPEHPVSAIVPGLGAAAHGGEVRAGLGLGEVHGAGPLAADHLGEVGVLEQVAAAQFDGLDGATGEHGAQAERDVGAVPHFLDQGRDQPW